MKLHKYAKQLLYTLLEIQDIYTGTMTMVRLKSVHERTTANQWARHSHFRCDILVEAS